MKILQLYVNVFVKFYVNVEISISIDAVVLHKTVLLEIIKS